MLKPSEVKAILKKYNLHPSKRLSQNFLIDQNIQEKLIKAIDIKEDDVVIEIGPGLGALTHALCKKAKKVIAIEKDAGFYNYLLKNKTFDNLELIHGDILRYRFSNSLKPKVVGNLPYYISSPIVIALLKERDSIDSIFITVQKEFAERLTAQPGSKLYGSISCFVQFYVDPVSLFTIKKNAFYPAPKVDSCFLKMDVLSRPRYELDERKLFEIIRTSFGKRRKTILNSLYSSGRFTSKQQILEKLKSLNIPPNSRPEDISLKQFADLANSL